MSDDYVNPRREIHPFSFLPDDLDSPVWHYMDWWKFESLVKNSAIYLRRVDLLEDEYEATHSPQQLKETDEWLCSIGYPHLVEQERQDRAQFRSRAYVSCWCVYNVDLDLMWKAYTKGVAVAIKSTVRHLQQVCDDAIELWPLDISRVKYIDRKSGQRVNYPGVPDIAFCKDVHFRLDEELRILHWPNTSGNTPDHVFVPVELSDVVVSAVISPATATLASDQLKMLNDLRAQGIPVEYSRYEKTGV